MQGLPAKVGLLSAEFGACWNPPLHAPLLWVGGLSSGLVSSPPLVLVLHPSGEGGGIGQCQTLCVTRLGLLVKGTTLFTVCGCIY